MVFPASKTIEKSHKNGCAAFVFFEYKRGEKIAY